MLRVDGPEARRRRTLTLDRPEVKNALVDRGCATRSSTRSTTSPATRRVKVVVITGAGDVVQRRLRPQGVPAARADRTSCGRRATGTTAAVLQFPLPAVAAVNGPALAGGFDLAVMCDVRVAASNRRASPIPRSTFGEVVYGPLHDLVGGGVRTASCASRAASSMRRKRSRSGSSPASCRPTSWRPR